MSTFATPLINWGGWIICVLTGTLEGFTLGASKAMDGAADQYMDIASSFGTASICSLSAPCAIISNSISLFESAT